MFRQNLAMVRLKGVPPTSNFFFIFDLFQTIIVSMGQVSLKYESYFWKFEISIFSGGQEPTFTWFLTVFIQSFNFFWEIILHL